MPTQAEVDALRSSLETAKEHILALEEEIQTLTKPPLMRATVLDVGQERLLLSQSGGGLVEVTAPDPKKLKCLVGDSVVVTQTGAVVEKTKAVLATPMVMVEQLHEPNLAEVAGNGGTKQLVLLGAYAGKVKEGDQVVVDDTGRIITHKFERQRQRFDYDGNATITWDDIGGQEEAKAAMIEAVESPRLHPKLYSHYNKKPAKGVLLSGPPGCGKTMLGKAAATAIARSYSLAQAPSGFMYIKGPEVLDPYVGVAEATIRSLFSRAREHEREHGFPAVLFIDEADAILGNRGAHSVNNMEKTMVPMFLAEMDGLANSGALVILSTNRPDALDPAIVRDGRIDRKVRVTRPNPADALAIFKQYLKGMPVKDTSHAQLAELAQQQLFCPKRVMYDLVLKDNTMVKFTLGQLASGAMIAGVVDKATSAAMRRDLKAGRPSGLKTDDIVEAIDTVFRENRDIDHTEAMIEFAFPKEVAHVAKVA